MRHVVLGAAAGVLVFAAAAASVPQSAVGTPAPASNTSAASVGPPVDPAVVRCRLILVGEHLGCSWEHRGPGGMLALPYPGGPSAQRVAREVLDARRGTP